MTNIHLLRISVIAESKEQWSDDIWTEPKLCSFRMITYEYGTENYAVFIFMCPAEI